MARATEGPSEEPSSDRACPVIDAIQQIGSEWRLVVLHDLQAAEEKRFNAIKRSTGAN
jgi:DNA-binding HxlR family transcriptional regulator